MISYDDLKRIEEALSSAGFKKQGRRFLHPSSIFYVEFLNPQIVIGHKAIKHFHKIKTPTSTIKLLTATDCVKDRLAAFFYWDDLQSLEQAVMVTEKQPIDFKNLAN